MMLSIKNIATLFSTAIIDAVNSTSDIYAAKPEYEHGTGKVK